jgi:hypothetical protein
MSVRTIRAGDVEPRPWRNGGGLTRELLAWPRAEAWRLRVSVAEVQADGPFSSFPGVQRWFAVLAGDGVELDVGGTAHRLTGASAPLCFAGDATTRCRLIGGPTRDLNLMLRGMRGGMFPAGAGESWRPRAAQCGLYAAVAGRCDGTGGIAVPANALLWFDAAPPALAFAPDDAAVAVAGWWLAATPLEDAAWA